MIRVVWLVMGNVLFSWDVKRKGVNVCCGLVYLLIRKRLFFYLFYKFVVFLSGGFFLFLFYVVLLVY